LVARRFCDCYISKSLLSQEHLFVYAETIVCIRGLAVAMHDNGDGVAENAAEATIWYRRAGELIQTEQRAVKLFEETQQKR